MAGSGKGRIAAVVAELCAPVAAELGLQVWDVEFVKEGGTSYLRIFIDSEAGITVEDTERMFRAMDSVLDEADPIAESYCLEVSSPGVEREIPIWRPISAMPSACAFSAPWTEPRSSSAFLMATMRRR